MAAITAVVSRVQLTIIIVAVFCIPCAGLKMDVSQKDELLPIGSNLTISCSDKRPFDMDWLLGRSHLSSCSLRQDISDCLPGGRFVVRPEDDTFQLNLVNLALHDCGTYTCKTHSVQRAHTINLIERVKMVDFSDTDHAITVKTSCVVPGYIVDIRWYYIHKDGTPRLYDQPTSRVESTEGCSGSCVDNKMVRVSSTLKLPITVKRPLLVKLRATVIQEGRLWHYTTNQDYEIEGCPPSTVDWVLLGFLCLICIVCLLHLGAFIYGAYRNRFLCYNSSRWFCALVSGVVFVFSITNGLLVQQGTRLPGACEIHNSVHHLPAAVGYLVIVIATLAKELLSDRKRMPKSKYEYDNQTKTQHLSKAGIEMQPAIKHATKVTEDIQQTPTKAVQSKEGSSCEEEKKLLSLDVTPEKSTMTLSFAKQWEKECSASLSGSIHNFSLNKVMADVGKRAILKFNSHLRTEDYPSWQKLNDIILNYGGHKKFLPLNHTLAWEDDKRSIVIRDVKPSDAGTYICIMSGGDVLTVDLVVYLPKQTITALPKSIFTLGVGECIPGPYPQWRRQCVVNTRFHENFNKISFQWGKDKKSLIIHDFRTKDEGLYEVSSNNCVQEFELHVQHEDKVPVDTEEVDAGITVRLECPDVDVTFPSWHCVNANIFNEAGSQKFLQPKSKSDLIRRLGWSVDKRSLLIRDVRLKDSGAYVCRLADDTCLNFELIVRAVQKIQRVKKDKVSLPCTVSDNSYPCWSARDAGCPESRKITIQNYPNVSSQVEWESDKKGLVILNDLYLHSEVRCSTYGGPVAVFKQR